jgi:tetratricopeptide (TPR) repeat protein
MVEGEMKTAESLIRKAERARRRRKYNDARSFMMRAGELLEKSGQYAEAEHAYRLAAADRHLHFMAPIKAWPEGWAAPPVEEASRMSYEAFALCFNVVPMYEKAADYDNAVDRYIEALSKYLEAAAKEVGPPHFFMCLGSRENASSRSNHGFWLVWHKHGNLLERAYSPNRQPEKWRPYADLVVSMMEQADKLQRTHDRAEARGREAPAKYLYGFPWSKCKRCGKPIPRGVTMCVRCTSVLSGAGAVYHRHHPRR